MVKFAKVKQWESLDVLFPPVLFEDELFPDWNILFNGSKAISSFGE
ncbi:hypothetical protein OAV29_02200 [Candidatus Poseidoniaceae archaeon]|jgi:hypothetical protein|nr:hypothetical protein [Candidatus Poseidoniaceae archaeon]|tara:strand:+ start:2306 stop:2443 length:138 start_codon:yes stop_codon:yes gene_type:complete